MTIERKLLGTTPVSGEVLPEAVSFDGSNDYLSRSSDMTGNTDSKTFTFSCWVYPNGDIRQPLYSLGSGSTWFKIEVEAGGKLTVYFEDGTVKYSLVIDGGIPDHTFSHVMVAFDGDTQANCQMYVNEINESYTTNTFVAGTLIQFADTNHAVGAIAKYASINADGRLSHVFLDYTYRDLSVTANRRLFIDADGKPSDTIPSSPILYLPMTDAATAGSNSGTGGDFTVNGVLATAERGPNQDNCSASTFDGSADYLSKTNGLSISNSKTVTCAFTFMPINNAGEEQDIIIFDDYNVGGGGGQGYVRLAGGADIKAYFELSGTGVAAHLTATAIITYGVHYAVAISFDTADSSKSKIYLNGVSQTLATNTMNNIVCEIDMNYVNIGRYRRNASDFVKGSLGELYFNNTYTDLATENPFWDSDANRPNSVRKVIEDTGVTPAIAMPLIGSDAGNNLGSGGDFTVNSGPYTGARGGSEFWARSADFNGSTGKLTRTSALVGSSNNKTMTIVCAVKANTVSTTDEIFGTNSSNNSNYLTLKRAGALFELDCDSSEGETLNVNFGSVSANTWYLLLISVDMSNTSKRHIYINGSDNNPYFGTYANFDLRSAEANVGIGKTPFGGYWDGDLGFLYFNNSYTDFSQEANRNKFVDQLGYPRDLTQQISDGDIPNPLVYMKFDPSSLGTNSGSGGNFTVNGTVTAGSDFTK